MFHTAQDPAENAHAFVPAAVYRRKKAPPLPFSEDEILEWADAFRNRHHVWPIGRSGPVAEAPGETWAKVDGALRRGGRGLLGNSSLALLLFRHRGRRHPLHLTRFTAAQVLEWAQAHFDRTGTWPGSRSGVIPECPAVTWETVQDALTEGKRGLPGGTTLSELLGGKRGAKPRRKPALSEAQILAWADEHFQRTGEWPRSDMGRIEPSADETWSKVHSALSRGGRGLPGGTSLAQLLQQERGTRNVHNLAALIVEDILTWADAHFERWGTWPVTHNKVASERRGVPEHPDLTWNLINQALRSGGRGLPGGSSLALLLEERRGKQHRLHLPPYTENLILGWADAHFTRHGKWPATASGPIPECEDSTWAGVSAALVNGSRGLPGGSSLAQLLHERRGRQHNFIARPLSEPLILEWADAFYTRYGHWPACSRRLAPQKNAIPESSGDTWKIVRNAMHKGARGMLKGYSLALLLAEKRGAANRHTQTLFTEEQILAWADAHFARTAAWPQEHSTEPLPECPDVSWRKVQNALRLGLRGMPGGVSLAALLEQRRGRRNNQNMPLFSEDEILQWADAFHTRTGQWPRRDAGPIDEKPDDTWKFVNTALAQGGRGLPGGSSLARLLHEQRGVFNKAFQTPLSAEQILMWADEHFAHTGEWPHSNTKDAIANAPTENWKAVSTAIYKGQRGLPGGSSLALLLQEQRGRQSMSHQPPLTVEQVLVWADAHHARMGEWPECRSNQQNPVMDAPGETWNKINGALHRGQRGLPSGTTLAQLLQEQRGKRNIKGLPPLTIEQILEWADAHFAQHGKWPQTSDETLIPSTSGEKWRAINQNLRVGDRSLPSGMTLTALLAAERGVRQPPRAPMTVEQITQWARAHRGRTGKWPSTKSGEVEDGDGTLWSGVHSSLYHGTRGLPGGSSLSLFCAALRDAEENAPKQDVPDELPRAA